MSRNDIERSDVPDPDVVPMAERRRFTAEEKLRIDVEDLVDVSPDVARAFWATLELYHRASSLAESFHSWLCPHLCAHRGMLD